MARILGSGRPLDSAHRASFEPWFGADLGAVRVHTGAASEHAAADLEASAFTIGSHIVFGRGAYRPQSGDGRRLLAHELAHVVQAGGSAQASAHTLSRRNDPAEREADRVADASAADSPAPALEAAQTATIARQEDPASSGTPPGTTHGQSAQYESPGPVPPKHEVNLAVFAALIEVFEGAAHGGSWTEFADYLYATTVRTLGTTTPAQKKEIRKRAAWIASLQGAGPAPEQKLYTIPGALSALEILYAKSSNIDGFEASFGLQHIVKLMARESAIYLVEGTAPSGQTPDRDPLESLTRWLDAAVDSLSDGNLMLMVELEGTIAKLAEVRGAFEFSKDRDERQRLGAEIGVLSRRAILLDEAARQARGPGGSALLEAVEKTLGIINGIQARAATESATMTALGGGLELLAERSIDLSASPVGDVPSKQAIDPETAFPEAVDRADERFQGELASRIEGLASQAAAVRSKVVPAGFELPDLVAAHQRWWAFYSQEQEKLDTTGSLAWKFFEDFYLNALGRDTGDSLASVQMGLGRGLLMPSIVRAVGGGFSRDFAGKLDEGGAHRDERTSGTAESPSYEFAEMVDKPSGTGAGDEVASRQRLSQARRTYTSAAMSAVAAVDEAQQPAMARSTGMAPDASVPIAHAGVTTAQQGWSYLVDVRDKTGLMIMDPPLVMREHKVVPPEVVEYLLTRRQQIATLQGLHTPKTASGQAIGGQGIPGSAGRALEYRTGMAAEIYVHGEPSIDRGQLQFDPTARKLRAAITAGLIETGAEPSPGDPAARAMTLLKGELESYLNKWMIENRVPAARVAGVIAIAQTEHGIKDSFKSFLHARDFVKMVAKAIAIAGGLAVLGMLGPIGRLASLAIGAYLRAQGVSNITAVISIGIYLKQVSEEATDLDSARGWALVTKGVAADLATVMENVVTLPFTEGIEHLARSARKTPGEAFEAIRPIVEGDPEVRQALLDAVNHDIADFDAGSGGPQSHPDREALVAFRDQLMGQTTLEGALGAEQTLHPDKQPPKGYEVLSRPRKQRTAAEWKAVHEAIGDRSVSVDENPHLKGTTVQIRYDESGVIRVEIGPDATPRHVADHAATVRELRSYEGVMGKIRILGSRILSTLRITPGFGDTGFEARAEVRKLRAIQRRLETKEAAIEKSLEHLSEDPAAARRELEAIRRELDGVEAQLKGWETQVDSFEKGRGIIAAVGTSGSQAPREYAVVQVTPRKIRYRGWVGFPADVPPNTVLEFPDGARVWRTDNGIAIESDIALGPGRAGYERSYPSRGQYADPGYQEKLYELAHSQGQGTGHESPYAIKLAPHEVNQRLQRHGIEEYLYRLRDKHPGVDFHLITNTEGVQRSRRLQSIEYSVWVTYEGKRQRMFEFKIVVEGTVGQPRILLPPDSVWVNQDPKLSRFVSEIDMSDVHDRFAAVDLSP